MAKTLRILIVEDSEDDARLMVRELKKAGYDLAWERVETRQQTEDSLNRQEWDLILCDYNLPQFGGLEALQLCRAQGLDLPFIIVSGAIGEDVAVLALKAGANDYLMKDNLARLAPAIERELRETEVHRQRYEAELALKQSQAQLAEAQALAHFGNWILDYDQGTLQGSDEAYHIFGLQPVTSLQFSKFDQLFYVEDQLLVKAGLELVARNSIPTEGEYRILLPGGEICWVHLKIHPMPVNPGQKGKFFCTVMDITERKRIEQNMLASQKMADLGTLAAGVAHEINSPLQVITGTSEVILHTFEKGEMPELANLQRKLEMIHRNAWRVAEIVRALLTYSRATPQQFREDDLNSIVHDSLLLIEHQLKSWSNIDIVQRFGKNMPVFKCDHNQIIQVLINLLTNARDAMPSGGTITLSTAFDETTNRLELKVEDNGIGIPESIQSRIFDPFFTTKPLGSGTGLGLSIVLGIVKAHGGDVALQSTPNQGTIFNIYFPIKPVGPDQSSRSQDLSNGRYGSVY